MDMPKRYGSYKTAWRRLWSKEGVWAKVLNALMAIVKASLAWIKLP
jgi:hypothetical protein